MVSYLSQATCCFKTGKISSGGMFVISTGEYCLVSVACVSCASAGSAHRLVNMAENERMAMQKCLAERVPILFQPLKIAEVFSPSLLWRSNWRNWLPSFSFQAITFSFVFVSLALFARRTFEDQENAPLGTTPSLPYAYLLAAALLTCLHIPMQHNIAHFSFSALAPVVLGPSSSAVAGCERR